MYCIGSKLKGLGLWRVEAEQLTLSGHWLVDLGRPEVHLYPFHLGLPIETECYAKSKRVRRLTGYWTSSFSLLLYPLVLRLFATSNLMPFLFLFGFFEGAWNALYLIRLHLSQRCLPICLRCSPAMGIRTVSSMMVLSDHRCNKSAGASILDAILQNKRVH